MAQCAAGIHAGTEQSGFGTKGLQALLAWLPDRYFILPDMLILMIACNVSKCVFLRIDICKRINIFI